MRVEVALAMHMQRHQMISPSCACDGRPARLALMCTCICTTSARCGCGSTLQQSSEPSVVAQALCASSSSASTRPTSLASGSLAYTGLQWLRLWLSSTMGCTSCWTPATAAQARKLQGGIPARRIAPSYSSLPVVWGRSCLSVTATSIPSFSSAAGLCARYCSLTRWRPSS